MASGGADGSSLTGFGQGGRQVGSARRGAGSVARGRGLVGAASQGLVKGAGR